MTATIDKPSVEFSEAGAIHRPGNGHVIHYRKSGRIYYHANTPDAVVRALEQARSCCQRIRVYLGETDPTKPDVGRDWLEEFDVEGYIGNSMGPLRVPLLIHNCRCTGGFPLLDHCIVKIKLTIGGILYQHPSYHTGTFTVRKINADESVHGDTLRDQGYTHAVDVNGQNHANFKTLAAAERYVRRMTT